MNIKELLSSSGRVKGYGREDNLKKQFGRVFLFNKKVKVKENEGNGRSVIEVTMHVSGLTDSVFDGKAKRPVAAHRVNVAIAGAEVQKVTQKELISRIRSEFGYSDEEKYPSEAIIAAVNTGELKLKGVTIMESDRSAGRISASAPKDEYGKPMGNLTYLLVGNKIPNDSIIQVHCTCSSYYWTFQWYNCDSQVDIFGKRPTKYNHKTEAGRNAFKSGHPMRNPGRHPGICKHITLLLAMLMKESTVESAKGMNIRLSEFKKNNGYLSRTEYEKLMREFNKDRKEKEFERTYLSRSSKSHNSSYKKNFWYRNMRGKEMKCICCDHVILNENLPCPNCGYKFDVSTDIYCPNCSFGKCKILGTVCSKGIDYNNCPTKIEIDRESF